MIKDIFMSYVYEIESTYIIYTVYSLSTHNVSLYVPSVMLSHHNVIVITKHI